MKYTYLIFEKKKYININVIEEILLRNNFNWLIDSEIENAEIEIKNNTLIWRNGTFYSGNFKYGIFLNGTFYGTFENGIIEKDVVFKGTFISGIRN